jgi:hypothetical protein
VCCHAARSRSKGVPTAPISASMPRLARQKLTISKDLYPSPPEHPTLPQDPSRRPLEGILARLTGCVGYLSVHAPVLCLVSSEAGGPSRGRLVAFPLGQGEIPGLPQCVPEPIYVVLAGETIPGLDTLVTGVWGMEDLRILTYPLRGSLLS